MFNVILTRRSLLKTVLACAGWLSVFRYAQAANTDTPTPKIKEQINMTPTELMMHSTVRIECRDNKGNTASGTGFFFKLFNTGKEFVPVIFTNKHVIHGFASCQFYLTRAKQDGLPDVGANILRIDITEPEFSKWIGHDDPTVDIAMFPCAELFNRLEAQGNKVFVAWIDQAIIPNEEQLKALTPVEDTLVVGYPDGIWDSVNNAPVFRRGITATAPYMNFNGKKEFLIDAAIFPGSSGSPVFLFNSGGYVTRNGSTVLGSPRTLFLGVVYAVALHTVSGEIRIEQAPTNTRPISISSIPNNLGICIMSSRLLEFEPLLIRKGMTQVPPGYVMRAQAISTP